MRSKLQLVSLLLVMAMCLGILASCGPQGQDEPTGTTSAESTESATEEKTDQTTDSTTQGDESSSDSESDSETESETEPDDEALLNIAFGPSIERAYDLTNGVQPYYPEAEHGSFIIKNQNMSLEYPLRGSDDQQVKYIKNTKGVSYIENTMDVFLKTTDGNTYYASKSTMNNAFNIYRLGYYYYDMRIGNQDFVNGYKISKSTDHKLALTDVNDVKTKPEDGVFHIEIRGTADPRFSLKNVSYAAEEYNAIQITIKATTKTPVAKNWTLSVLAGGEKNINSKQQLTFPVACDGEAHTYTLMLDEMSNMTDYITTVRFDINGVMGDAYDISDVKFVKAERDGLRDVRLLRSFNTYSDKLHEMIQIAVQSETKNVAAIGTVTTIAADTVNKIIVKDAKGIHDSLDKVDWATAEYVGFDIKDAGIFGYILPFDYEDKLEVTLKDGVYTIIQSRAPKNNTLIPSGEYSAAEGKYVSIKGYEGNVNDFYMGHRIYTDESHSFDAFLHEAYCERNPLTGKNIKVSNANSDNGEFVGYDSLRGIYTISLDGTGFNPAYYGEWNRHFRAQFTVGGDDKDRNVYFMSTTTSGNLESAALLNENDMMLPIQLEVCKNFTGDGEYSLFYLDDKSFGEVIFPMVIKAEERTQLTLLNLYQNWGQFPLKQISSIQFGAPYYHLSTGVTESNCIMPFFRTNRDHLPDHRAASAPMWANQPQHTSGGFHRFYSYTDSEGNFIAGDNISNVIDSYGPVYTDVNMTFLSDDGKIKGQYYHLEFPQTDENRAFYEIKLEVLEDVTINDFKNDFSFYSVKTNQSGGARYKKLGYLDKDNKCQVVDANTGTETVSYVLGTESPYFDYFMLSNKDDYVNVSFVIHSYEFIIGGEKVTPNFIINDLPSNNIYLSLDLGKVELKAGDTLTVNAIITPWGSQLNDYSGENGIAPDQNVRNIRQDSCLNPLRAEAKADCEIIESVFLPKVKSTNGKSAEFTLKGGANNVPVRIYGFDTLTAPKVYELVDGKWVPYALQSYVDNTYDYFGYAHNYDGYNVYYEGDGTFSYAFAVDMGKDGKERTFKIEASEEFKGWDRVPEKEPYDPLNLYIDPIEIYQKTNVASQFKKEELSIDSSYSSLYSKADSLNSESFFYAYQLKKNEEAVATGQYIVLKYRLPETNFKKIHNVEFYTTTSETSPIANNSYYLQKCLIADGEWHVLIVDILEYIKSKNGKRVFETNENGEYCARYLRFDVFNSMKYDDMQFDIAYVGMHDDLAEIRELNSDMDQLTYATSEGTTYYMDTKTGALGGLIEIVKEEIKEPEVETEDLEGVTEDTTPAIIEYDAEYLYNKTGKSTSFKGVTISDDKSYVSYIAKASASADVNFTVFSSGTQAAGKYIFFKYRLPSTNGDKKLTVMEFYTSTLYGSAKAGSGTFFQHCLTNDGEWHLAIFDVKSHGKNTTFRMNAEGKYIPQYLRFDIFNGKIEEGLQIDISFIGMSNSLDAIFTEHFDMQTATLSTSEGKTASIDSTVNPPVIDPNAPVYVRIDAEALYNKKSSLATLSEDKKTVTFTSVGADESTFTLLNNNTEMTGQYLVIKYRVPTTNASAFKQIQFYTSTTSPGANNNNSVNIQSGYVNDGDWHIVVIDLVAYNNDKVTIGSRTESAYKPADNGTYTALFNRFDVFNGTPEGIQIEFEYIEYTNSLARIFEQNPEFESVKLCKSETASVTLNKDLTESK